jgi:NADH:ubiquinone oxidoreductase subunit F (NADH-binding)/NADH:ubiquinone oxidoreductase subunit E
LGSITRELIRLQAEHGWLPEAALRELAEQLGVPLHRLESVSTFYTHFRREAPPEREIEVCRDVACRLAGGAEAAEHLRRTFDGAGVALRDVSCLGRCDAAPAGCVGERVVSLGDVAEVEAALVQPTPKSRPVRRWAADPYEPGAGYGALRSAVARFDADAIIASLETAGLRGMGGAGFPTARKWRFVAAEPALPKYVICNADESEPATFKDREILHDLPHLVLEGMALAGLCTGASRGIVFIRHEYAAERLRLEAALENARELGALGGSIFGSGLAFDVEVFVSPGGYILGEETALLECLEDRRGEPRNKPPLPGRHGLHGQPTLINNVETLAHAAAITARGADWWRGLGRRGRAGHKFMAVCGDVARPGVVIVPFGTTLGELLEASGGIEGGRQLAAVAPGGASSTFLGPAALDVPIDFEAIAGAGSMLGSGAALFVAAGRDLLEVGTDVTRFFRNESCGKCVPCRVGTEKAVQLLERTRGLPDASGRTQLRELHATLARTSICGLGQVALAPLLSIVDRLAPDEPLE